MQRIIKFRAWDAEKKEMRRPCGNMLIDSLDGHPYWQFGYNEPEPMGALTLMQFTGLHDKNGKDVWEGDLVRAEVNNRIQVGMIEWDDNGFYITHLSRDNDWTLHPEHAEPYEVIGNVFENPDLLKQ